MHKHGITLIELMVVIIVLGIISLIALPNIKNIKSKAEISAAMENKNTVQKGVDKYFLDKQELPTTSEPEVGLPVQIDWSKLVPPYVRSKPTDLDKIYYWVDYNNTVWVSDVDAPQDVLLDADGKTVSWSEVSGATEYKIGYIEETASKVNGKIVAGKSYKVLQKVSGTSYVSPAILTGKTVVVSSISKNFESVPVGAGYTGNTLEGGTGEQQSTTNHKPMAVITMSPEQTLTTATTITWGYENSTDEDGDQITNAEWEGKQDIYTTEGTYTIKLRVQDLKGDWSDWVEKTFSVINANGVKQISASEYHTVALMNNGTVKTWGENNYGQLGDGTQTNHYTPTLINGINNVKQIIAGGNHTVALMEDGTVKTWGRNYYGELGYNTNKGTNNPNSTPTAIPGLTGVKQIAAGNGHTVALMNDGTVKTWGLNYYGELGYSTNIGTYNVNFAPTTIPGLTGVTEVATGYYHTLALMADGTVKAWGRNDYGQLGIGSLTSRYSPILVSGLSNVKQISAGLYFTVALMEDGTVKAWGDNSDGQLGDGTTNQRYTPSLINGLTNVKQIATGERYVVILLNDGTVKTWGSNVFGQLGDGTQNGQKTPIIINGLNNINQITAGWYHTITIANDGTVKVCGYNIKGQLGDGTITNRSVPTTININ